MIISKKKRIFQVFICSVLLAALFSTSMPIVQGANENAHEYRYHFRRYTDNSAPLKHMYYHLYIPEDYNESLAYPLVIYLSLIGQDVAVNSMNYIDSSLLANGNAKKYPWYHSHSTTSRGLVLGG